MEDAVDQAIEAARKNDAQQLAKAMDAAMSRVQGVQSGVGDQGTHIAELEKQVSQLEQLVKDNSDSSLRCKLIALRSSLLVAKQPINISPQGEDVIWVYSVPPGADVWCEYRDLMENDLKWGSMVSFQPRKNTDGSSNSTGTPHPFKASSYRGQTPLAMTVIPGQYVVGVAIPISREYGNEGLKEFPYKPTEARESFVASDGELMSYTRIFTVEKNDRKAATVSTVFCPRGTSFDDAIAAFPASHNFQMDETAIRETLEKLGQDQENVKPLSTDQIQTILASLSRSGTALLSVNTDDTFVVAGLRDRDSLSATICKQPDVMLTPPSMPQFTAPVIPNLNIPPVVPNINIPKIEIPVVPVIPGLGASSSSGQRRRDSSNPATDRTQDADEGSGQAKETSQVKSKRGTSSTKGNRSSAASGKLQVARNLLKVGKRDAAKERLEALIRDFPETSEASEAKQELELLK